MSQSQGTIRKARPIPPINADVLRVLKKGIASSRQRQSRSLPVLTRAYQSLKACPLAFTSLHELQQLEGFESDALLRSIAQWLQPTRGEMSSATSFRAEESTKTPASSHLSSMQLDHASSSSSTSAPALAIQRIDEALRLASGLPASKRKAGPPEPKTKAPKLAKAPKLYIPQPRTGSHGILVALFSLTGLCPSETEGDDSIEPTSRHAKATIIEHGQQYSDSSYIPKPSKPGFGAGPASFHSAWSGMKTLINRGYVYRTGNPARFSLSHTGWQVAKVCAEREGVGAGSELVPAQELIVEDAEEQPTASRQDEVRGELPDSTPDSATPAPRSVTKASRHNSVSGSSSSLLARLDTASLAITGELSKTAANGSQGARGTKRASASMRQLSESESSSSDTEACNARHAAQSTKKRNALSSIVNLQKPFDHGFKKSACHIAKTPSTSSVTICSSSRDECMPIDAESSDVEILDGPH